MISKKDLYLDENAVKEFKDSELSNPYDFQLTEEELNVDYKQLYEDTFLYHKKDKWTLTRRDEFVLVTKMTKGTQAEFIMGTEIVDAVYRSWINREVSKILIKKGNNGKEACVVNGKPNPDLVDSATNMAVYMIIKMIKSGHYKLSYGAKISTFASYYIKNVVIEDINGNFDDFSKRDHEVRGKLAAMDDYAEKNGIVPTYMWYLENAEKFNLKNLTETLLIRVKEQDSITPLSLEGYEGVISSNVGNPEKEVLKEEEDEDIAKANRIMNEYDKFGVLCIDALMRYWDYGFPSQQIDFSKLHKVYVELYTFEGYKQPPDKANFIKYFNRVYSEYKIIMHEVKKIKIKPVGYSSRGFDITDEAMNEFNQIMENGEMEVFEDYDQIFEEIYPESKWFDDYDGYEPDSDYTNYN